MGHYVYPRSSPTLSDQNPTRETPFALPSSRQSPWTDGWLCALVTLVLFLAARPYVEMGLVDDFSYVKTAWVFAHTGHLVYNGWATAMLGWQIPASAPFILLFGDTFFAARLLMTVLLVLCVVLTHSILDRAGLTRERAAFGALLIGLSPLTFPMAASFMTDITGLFVILLCLYCALCALSAVSNTAVLLWLVAGFAASAIGGTARQTGWVAGLVLVPSAGWLLRKRPGVLALSIVGAIANFFAAILSLRWFKHQPLSTPEPFIPGHLGLHSARELMGTLLAAALCLAFLLVPVLVEALPAIRRFRFSVIAAIAACTIVFTFIARYITFHLMQRGLFPWTGDILGHLDIFDPQTLWRLGDAPVTFTLTTRWVASFVVIALLFVFLHTLWKQRKNTSPKSISAMHTLRVLLLPFCAVYTVMLFPRGIWAEILDRYLLPLLVIAALFLLRLTQDRLAVRLRALPWAILAIFSLWSVAGLHDWIESHRARLAAVARVQAAGVSLTNISAGYEFDGLTQINLRGTVIDKRVTYPAGFDTSMHYPEGLPARCHFLYMDHTASLEPQYFVTFAPQPCLAPSSFGEVTYQRWLPPFTGHVYIDQLAP